MHRIPPKSEEALQKLYLYTSESYEANLVNYVHIICEKAWMCSEY